MQIPEAGIIEAAVDALKGVPQDKLDRQLKEMHNAIGDQGSDYNYARGFDNGYNLGLQTARLMLATNTLLQLKGIKAEDIL